MKVKTNLNHLKDAAISFFRPKATKEKIDNNYVRKIVACTVVPSINPKMITFRLVKSLATLHPQMKVIFVDDSTPKNAKGYKVIRKIKKLALKNKSIICLRTPTNKLKAGALNYGIDYIKKGDINPKPSVVITLDDDVILKKNTISEMIKYLYSDSDMGAACTIAKVKNKNKSVLTRLQAMEYHNFNITKISDNGFLKGPLVMPGMITAFRYEALEAAGGFTTGHLIEDYDLTAKLKLKGWYVGIAKNAEAWTEVPEKLGDLWRQRIRWTLGGLDVIKDYWKSAVVVFQDLFGHFLFLTLFAFIVMSFVFVCESVCGIDPMATVALIFLAIVNVIAANSFNLITFFSYSQRDRVDWMLKLSFIPEFIYSNFLTTVLVGSYIYFVYAKGMGYLAKKTTFLGKVYKAGLKLFSKAGYSYAWGTREVGIA